MTDKLFSFALNNLRIKNDDEMKTFLQLFVQLIRLTDGECSLIGELADLSAPNVVCSRFDVDASGAYTLEIAAIN